MVTWKVLAEYSWSPTTIQSGSFLCTAASSTPIRVVTKEVSYIHELSLTLEHSMSISSPAVPGLTNAAFIVADLSKKLAYASRVLMQKAQVDADL